MVTKEQKNTKGITLIALIVTILIILILAGVTISTLTNENGIINKVIKANELTEISTEEEALDLYILSTEMGRAKIGNRLEDPTLSNGTTWNIWVGNVDGTQKTYGDGWYFIDENTKIDDDWKTNNKWLVNYETGEKVKIDETFTPLYYGASLAITDGLVFNVDPTNLTNINNLGEGVTAHGFDDENETGGIVNGVLRFDGGNDYITVDGTLDVSDEITIEFYGKANGYCNYKENGEDISKFKFIPFLSTYSSKYSFPSTQNEFMRVWSQYECLANNFGYISCGNAQIWENQQAQQNLRVAGCVVLNKEFMATITYNHSTQIYSVYMEGVLKKDAQLAADYWKNFKDNISTNVECFQIGIVKWNGIMGYLNGEVYSVRIYNKALTAEQVEKNYTATKKYRELNSTNQ